MGAWHGCFWYVDKNTGIIIAWARKKEDSDSEDTSTFLPHRRGGALQEKQPQLPAATNLLIGKDKQGAGAQKK